MDIATLIGFALGFGGIFGGSIMEGGSPLALINISAFMIVFSTSGQKRISEEDVEELRLNIMRTRITVNAHVGTAILTARELGHLTVGNVIRLDRPANREVQIRIANRQKFHARPGRVRRKLAFRITAVASEEERAVEAGTISGSRTLGGS